MTRFNEEWGLQRFRAGRYPLTPDAQVLIAGSVGGRAGVFPPCTPTCKPAAM